MAENKLISELSGITNPSLTGYTVYDDGNTTYKLPLGELVAYVTTAEGDYVTTSSFNTFTGSVNQMMSSLNPVLSSLQTSTSSLNTFTSSLNGKTGSFATTGSNIFNGQQTIKGSVIIGPSGSLHTDNPEILHVNNSGSFNITHFEGNSNTYLQVNIKNTNSSAGSSTDFVATADNGTEDLHYVNMGINSSGFDNEFSVGYQNDAYLINRGRDLYIGSLDGPDYNHTHVHLFSSNSWQNPQISIISDSKIGFNTGSVTTGYTYEFSGSVKLQDELKVDGSVTASYFVGDGSQLTNLPNGLGSDIADFTFTSETISNNNITLDANDTITLQTSNGDIILDADGDIYRGSANPGNELLTRGIFDETIGDTNRINNSTGNSITNNLDNAVYYLNAATSSYATTGSNTFTDNQIISGSKYLSVETIQNLSGSINLTTAGSNVNVLGSNLMIPNGGLFTSFDLSVSGSATIGGTLNLGQTTERITSSTTSNTIGNFDFEDSSVFYITGATSNFSAFVWNVPDFTNKGIGLSFMIEQGLTPYTISELVVNDGTISILWNGGTPPTGNANNLDIISFSLLNVNGTIKALGQLTTFS